MSRPDAAEADDQCPLVMLFAFTVGDLPGELQDQIALHLSACPHCVATLNDLHDGADPLLAHLQPAGPGGVLVSGFTLGACIGRPRSLR